MRAGLVWGAALGGAALMSAMSPLAVAEEATVKQLLSVEGECTEVLHVGKIPQYRSCGGIVFQFMMSDGYQVIMWVGGGSRYYFIGKGANWNQKGGGRMTVTAVAAGTGDAFEEIPAKGTCRFDNLHSGKVATVSCSATMSKGHWSAAFKSDGKPPIVPKLKS
ncbi:hypothetical protein RUR49_24855 [Pseudoxanthobacter sp. M-2]|uniref:hypothetical protein n=1 Tax=Pseudoxanthobacter sp. M-2 TaxID=3078754 RepID=UPI0038FC3207